MTSTNSIYRNLQSATTPVIAAHSQHRTTSMAPKLHSLTNHPPCQISSNTFLTLVRPIPGFFILIFIFCILGIQFPFGLVLSQEQDKDTPKEETTGFNIPIKVPVFGIEYLGASSETTHADTLGSATENWNLPVLGRYITVDIPISDKITSFYLRPISLGLYHFSDLFNAGLAYSPFLSSLTGSYRRLKFTNVELTHQGGFTVTRGGGVVLPSTLPESPDYI